MITLCVCVLTCLDILHVASVVALHGAVHRVETRDMGKGVATDSTEFLTVDEAADLLRVGRKRLYAAIDRGEVRGVKRIGRTIRIRRAALLADEQEAA